MKTDELDRVLDQEHLVGLCQRGYEKFWPVPSGGLVGTNGERELRHTVPRISWKMLIKVVRLISTSHYKKMVTKENTHTHTH